MNGNYVQKGATESRLEKAKCHEQSTGEHNNYAGNYRQEAGNANRHVRLTSLGRERHGNQRL